MEQTQDINKKLEIIEGDIESLKSMMIKISQGSKPSRAAHIKEALKGVTVTEDDIAQAKNSLFKAG